MGNTKYNLLKKNQLSFIQIKICSSKTIRDLKEKQIFENHKYNK